MMPFTRRHLLASIAATSVTAGSRVYAAPLTSLLGRDATQLGVKPNSPDDQTALLQRAIETTARDGVPLALPPGIYRTGRLDLPNAAQIIGVRGATKLMLTNGSSLLASRGADAINLSGLTFDGADIRLPERQGLVHLDSGRDVHITDCDMTGSGGNGIVMEGCSGEIRGTTIRKTTAAAIFSFDARGLLIAQNTIQDASENGILIFRSAPGDDGTIVIDNRVEDIKAGPGGSGQYGNAINAFRANNVIVRGNRIRNCDFSAVRGNSASNIQILGNSVSDVREVALYSEFAFEGAVIASNAVDGCTIGVSITNFNEGGRLAVVQGNILRNMLPKRPVGTDPGDTAGIGIAVEADAAVTGNVVENAPSCGITAGFGRYLRDVAITGNVVRNAPVGIGVSVAAGAGQALVEGNVMSNTPRGAVVGFNRTEAVTGDLMVSGAADYPKIVLGKNAMQ